MSNMLENLEKILRYETVLHDKMLEQAEAKRTAIIDGNIELMEEVLRNEEELLRKIEKTEEAREQVVQKIQQEFGIEDTPVKISDIIKHAGEYSQNLEEARTGLKNVISKLSYRNRQNAELLKASIEHVNSFMRMITLSSGPATYNNKGNISGNGLRLIDRRV